MSATVGIRKRRRQWGLRSWRHYPIKSADAKLAEGEQGVYLVATIVPVFATEKGRKNYEKVHRNIYRYRLPELLEWLHWFGREQAHAEKIISIDRELVSATENPAKGTVPFVTQKKGV